MCWMFWISYSGAVPNPPVSPALLGLDDLQSSPPTPAILRFLYLSAVAEQSLAPSRDTPWRHLYGLIRSSVSLLFSRETRPCSALITQMPRTSNRLCDPLPFHLPGRHLSPSPGLPSPAASDPQGPAASLTGPAEPPRPSSRTHPRRCPVLPSCCRSGAGIERGRGDRERAGSGGGGRAALALTRRRPPPSLRPRLRSRALARFRRAHRGGRGQRATTPRPLRFLEARRRPLWSRNGALTARYPAVRRGGLDSDPPAALERSAAEQESGERPGQQGGSAAMELCCGPGARGRCPHPAPQ